jgi:hypothetical protein
VEINLESTGMKKGCNFLGVKNWQTLAVLWAGALSCNKRKSQRRTKLDEPNECPSGGNPLLLYKILHLLFFPLVWILCALPLCTNTSVSVADRPALKQNFMATLCSFPPSMTYKENWLYKTSYNSYTVKDKQMKFGVCTDNGWYY